jgi:hypothetical protein
METGTVYHAIHTKPINTVWGQNAVVERAVITVPYRDNIKYTDVDSSVCGPGSVDGIATDYGLDDPGIETRWGRDFPHLSRTALEPTQPPVQWLLSLSWGYRAAGA